MNNEVLRRKMFRTVLADSRAPAGILASSPEMVRTVQKRVGGAQAGSYELNLIPELVQRGDVQALQALTAPSYPKQVRLAASQALGSVTTKQAGSPTADFLVTSGQQLARAPREAVSDALTDAGELGQGILNVAAGENKKFVDSVKTAARNDANRLSSVLDFVRGTGEIATPISEPGEGITALIKKGIKKMGSDLRQITDPIDRKLGYLTYDETEGMAYQRVPHQFRGQPYLLQICYFQRTMSLET